MPLRRYGRRRRQRPCRARYEHATRNGITYNISTGRTGASRSSGRRGSEPGIEASSTAGRVSGRAGLLVRLDRAFGSYPFASILTKCVADSVFLAHAVSPEEVYSPELASAAAAARLLATNGLPPGMEFDRLVVDEAQDLTLTEFWMLLELLRACRRRTGKSPWLLVAGDAGQRVEASGFEWGRYTELLSSRWRKPATFDLVDHVRCPARIAAVVNRSSIFYALVDKNRRPEKQQRQEETEHVTGTAISVRVDDREQARDLVERLAALEGTAVITAAQDPPAWLDERRRKLVLTPAEAKGLEYQQVCVLDAGAAIESFNRSQDDERTALRQESRRTAIDQLRVALSRATETLAVVNVEPTTEEDLATLALVGGTGRYRADDLIERFGTRRRRRKSGRTRPSGGPRPSPRKVESLSGRVRANVARRGDDLSPGLQAGVAFGAHQRRQGSPSTDRSSSRGTVWPASSGGQVPGSAAASSTLSSSAASVSSAGLSAWRRSQARRLRHAMQRSLSGQTRRPQVPASSGRSTPAQSILSRFSAR